MLRYLIQVVQTALTTAIVCAFLFAELYKKDGQGRGKHLAAGIIAGTAASLILAVLRRTTALINRGFFNTCALSLAIVAAVFFILLYWGLVQKKNPPLREVLLSWVSPVLTGALLFYVLPTIFLYPTEFLLAGESLFTTDFLFKLIGYLAGLGITGLTALAIFKISKAVQGPFPGILLTVILGINIVSQLAAILQFLLARRIIPMARWLFRIVAALVNNNMVFLYITLGLTLALPILVCIKSLKPKESYANPAEHRKIKAAHRGYRRWSLVVILGYGISICAVTFIKAYTERGVELSPAEPMTIAGEEILIPIERVEDGHLHRFAYTASDNTEVRFIVIRKNEIAYGVGLDACDICGATGYYERKNEVICRLCDVVMNISTIGFKGGCNPVPLAYRLRSGSMVIEIQDLEKEKVRFK
ncbi:MAG: Fe-S-containing protein [Spirochaetaceae bacterium]|jgi:uncharacterized membrane protein|nr:Fe-S-containing protein [Spirochaetaceae bacterium]